VPESFKEILQMSRGALELFESCQKRLLKELVNNDGGMGYIDSLYLLDILNVFDSIQAIQFINFNGEHFYFNCLTCCQSYNNEKNKIIPHL